MAQPSFDMGQLAANLILEEIKEEGLQTMPHQRKIKPELIIRKAPETVKKYPLNGQLHVIRRSLFLN